MKSDDAFDDDNTPNRGGAPSHSSVQVGEDDIEVLTCAVHVRPQSHIDGSLCLTGYVSHDDILYTYVWDNCIDSVESRLTLLFRKHLADSIVDLADYLCWVHDFTATTAGDNLIRVALDCMLNDMRATLHAPAFLGHDENYSVWTPSKHFNPEAEML